MEIRNLGGSGLRVSAVGLGCNNFGQRTDLETSRKVIHKAIDLGITLFDTADIYAGRGGSETVLGEVLGNRRKDIVLATKYCKPMSDDGTKQGASRRYIMNAVEDSLRRLKTDYIDLYWLHNWDRHTPIDETMAALHDLVRAGKVRYLGISDTPAWKTTQAQMIAQFRGWTPFIGLQIEYSLLERTVEGELIPMAQELGMGVTPWSPLRSGLLSGKYTRANAATVQPDKRTWVAGALNEEAYRVIDELQTIARELDSTPARVAVAWVQGRPGVSSTILGARTLQQLDDNLAAIDVKLGADHIARLDALTRPKLNFPAEFLGMAGMIQAGGTVINGEVSQMSGFGVTRPGDHY